MIPSILFYVPLSFELLGLTTTPTPDSKPGPTTPSFQTRLTLWSIGLLIRKSWVWMKGCWISTQLPETTFQNITITESI